MNLHYDTFGQITVDDQLYPHDVVVDRKSVVKRLKKNSKHLRSQYGHTPTEYFHQDPEENWSSAQVSMAVYRSPMRSWYSSEAQPT